MDICAKSDVGIKRSINEDNYGLFSGDSAYFIVVADGMGGHNAGEVASDMVVKHVLSMSKLHNHPFISIDEAKVFAKSCLEQANNLVYKSSVSENENQGMGTTAVMAIIFDNNLVIANVGDSRAYMISDDKQCQITVDHSYIEELIKFGVISREESENHPSRHIITRAIGSSYELEVDVFTDYIHTGDKIIICTDGLSTMIGSNSIYEIACSYNNSEEICDKLIKQANNSGGNDNITVAVIRF